MLLHADAVAQDRAAGDAAGGIDRDDRHGLALPAQLALPWHRPACSCPRPGGPVMPTITRVPGERLHFAQQRQRLGIAILDACGGAGQRAQIACADLLRPIAHQLFRSCRAITRRWISLVPSPMVQSFTSR